MLVKRIEIARRGRPGDCPFTLIVRNQAVI
jgi:hypothetical protein